MNYHHLWNMLRHFFSNHQPFAKSKLGGETPKRRPLVQRNSHESGRTQEKAVSFCLPLRAPVLVNVLKGLKQTLPSCYHRLAMECTLLTKWMSKLFFFAIEDGLVCVWVCVFLDKMCLKGMRFEAFMMLARDFFNGVLGRSVKSRCIGPCVKSTY